MGSSGGVETGMGLEPGSPHAPVTASLHQGRQAAWWVSGGATGRRSRG